jgi:hypothetical protein
METDDRPSRPCPRCGNTLHPGDDSAGATLLCSECWRCWHQEAGYLVQVNPYACTGCPNRRLCLHAIDDHVDQLSPRPAY